MRQGTKCVQAGYRPGNGEPRQIPIVQSTTFRYDTSEDMGKLFDLEAEGYFYSRLQNPTNDTVAAKICALEGGSAAMLTSSGQAANFMALFNIAGAGDHIVASSSIYGGTFNLIGTTMKRMGVDVTFLSPDSTYEEIRAAIRPNTKAVFGETIANPALTVLDIETWAKAAHDGGVPLVIDNTFATPVLCRPIEHGADIVTHSTTKYMDGHGASIGGAIIDSGNFDWTQNDRFPGLTTPDESYHGVVYTEKFGQGGAYITKATSQLMRDLGCVQSPQNAFYINLGLESLHLRMKRHSETALAVAQFLDSHPKVEAVQYAGLPRDKYHALAEKYLPDGCCGVVSFEIKGGRAAAERVMKALKTAAIETHVADARSCCLHPASATHRQMTDEQLTECGISPSMIRFSCGLEDAQDLIDDLAQALEQA
ncbi:O-acetylhomoserine aminocarboxypropyltransferase/cysteine synthase family protein [Faecalibaculum rodentium]|uniref:O-acetylhomoserine aminocarboxypropyltransferase/cysteine synthase family protein n=1 Tax=Faecalibaculum rodentium TaxID=1702221 RepID=UPI0023F04DAE|nr:O-acetylhomoserine aminocarboxypropyltransferase/cysteine synthase family protein [Faecalibaculum rodentium]